MVFELATEYVFDQMSKTVLVLDVTLELAIKQLLWGEELVEYQSQERTTVILKPRQNANFLYLHQNEENFFHIGQQLQVSVECML